MSSFYTILFHALYDKNNEGRERHPYLYVAKQEFSDCIQLLLNNGFTFLNPKNLSVKDGNDKQILLTFDDGYYNNYHALDVLSLFRVHGLFFFVKTQIKENSLFWWDVYFKNMIEDESFEKIYKEIQTFKSMTYQDIISEFHNRFGKDCFVPDSDFDRPMTVDEVATFAAHPFVNIGAHSTSHEILTNLEAAGLYNELKDGKDFLESVIKNKIDWISYPNGNFNDTIISHAASAGFKNGLTTIGGANKRSSLANPKDRLALNRNVFPIPGETNSVLSQVEAFIEQVGT